MILDKTAQLRLKPEPAEMKDTWRAIESQLLRERLVFTSRK
jgi:hypothetical protein